MKKPFYLLLLIMFTSQLHCQITKPVPKVVVQPKVCSLQGSELAERNKLMKERIRPLLSEVAQLEHGYSFLFPFTEDSYYDLFNFIELERKCCSFISYHIKLPANQDKIVIEIIGSNSSDIQLIRNCWQID